MNFKRVLIKLFGYPYSMVRFFAKVEGATKFRKDLLCRRRAFESAHEYQKVKLTWFLKKKYKKYIIAVKEQLDNTYDKLPHKCGDTVWVCWLQGLDNAPEIVKLCCNSIVEKLGDVRKVCFLDKNNYKNYIALPDFVEKKYSDGIISDAQFTDLIRLALLTEYGGTWIDATIMCTDKLPDYMLDSELFLPCTSMWETYQLAFRVESYFITAYSNDKILSMALKLAYKYWSDYNFIAEYLLIYSFIEIAIELYGDEWEKVHPFPRADINLLQEWFERKYDKQIFDEIIARSPIHKLTYKVSEECIKDGDNFYNHIIRSRTESNVNG